MDIGIVIFVVTVLSAQSHLSYGSSYSSQPYGDRDTNSNSDAGDKDTSIFCALQKAEKESHDGAIGGLDAMFGIPIRFLRKYGPNNGHPSAREDEAAIQKSEDKSYATWSTAAEPPFTLMAMIRPKSRAFIEKMRELTFRTFVHGCDQIYDAIRLSYETDPKEVQREIDSIEPEVIASVTNGVAFYFTAMRATTQGMPVILATNGRAEEEATANVIVTFRTVVQGIRIMLDGLVNCKESGDTRGQLLRIQELKEKANLAVQKYFRILYNAIREWGKIGSGEGKSCY